MNLSSDSAPEQKPKTEESFASVNLAYNAKCCDNCGAVLKPDTKFCWICGAKI